MTRIFPLLLCVFFSLAASWGAPTDTIPLDNAISYGKLENGLTYYVFHCDRPAYKINFYLINNIGSAVEKDGEYGMAHFLEHMSYNGSKHFPDNQMLRLLEKYGIKFGYDINAYTSSDATVFNISNISSRLGPEAIDTSLRMLRDISCDLSLTPSSIEKEKAIILEEWRQGNDAFKRMSARMFQLLFGKGHPYTHLPIGMPDNIEQFDRKKLKSFYDKWYQPQHQAVVVIGDVNPDAIAEKIKEIWGDVWPAKPSQRQWAQVPNHNGIRAGVITEPEFPGSQIDMWFKVDIPPRSQRNTVQYINDSYIGNIARSALAQRLGEIVYEENSPFSHADIDFSQYYMADSKDALRIFAIYDKSHRQDAIQRIVKEAKRAGEMGITQEEFDAAVKSMKSVIESLPSIYDEKNNDEHFTRISEHFLKGNIVTDLPTSIEIYSNFVDTVKVEQVNAMLRKHLRPDNLTVTLVEKETGDATLPSDLQFKELLENLWQDTDIDEYVADTTYRLPFIDAPLQPKAPIYVAEDSTQEARHYTFANGARATVCRRSVLNDQIDLRAVHRGGTAVLLDSSFVDGYFAPGLADLGGLGKFSRTQLARKLSGTQAYLDTRHTAYAEIIEGSSAIAEIDTLLQMLYLRLTDIRQDNVAFENWRKVHKAQIIDMHDNPDFVFSDSIRSVLCGKDNRFLRRFRFEDFDSIDYEHVLDLMRQRFQNPASWHFIIVGNVDYDSIQPKLEKYIGNLPGNGFIDKEPFHLVERKSQIGVRDVRFAHPSASSFAKVYAAYEVHRPYNITDEMTMALLKAILMRELLNVLRTEEGVTYSPKVDYSSGEADGFHSLFFSFDTNSDAATSSLEKAREQLQKIAKHGPDKDIFKAEKEYLLNEEIVSTLQQSYPLAYFTHKYLYEDEDYANRYAALNYVTPDMVKEMAKALLKAPVRVSLIMDGITD